MVCEVVGSGGLGQIRRGRLWFARSLAFDGLGQISGNWGCSGLKDCRLTGTEEKYIYKDVARANNCVVRTCSATASLIQFMSTFWEGMTF